MSYDRTIGRLRISLSNEGARNHNYGHGVEVFMPTGWNASCQSASLRISVEEMRDLRYLLDRAIAAAESERK